MRISILHTQTEAFHNHAMPRNVTPLDHDHQVRAHLRTVLQERLRGDDRLVEELPIALSIARADLALINGHLEGYEIKAERDTLVRLQNQIQAYGMVFDTAYAVTTRRHAKSVQALLPKWWGLKIAEHSDEGVTTFHLQRESKQNPSPKAAHVVRLLWRDELIQLLETADLLKGRKSQPKHILYDVAAEHIPFDVIHAHVRQSLKARTNW